MYINYEITNKSRGNDLTLYNHDDQIDFLKSIYNNKTDTHNRHILRQAL